jgi:DNA-binding CsgD family transcriptional regulator/tetratricopeptide (TPR) repeat protein
VLLGRDSERGAIARLVATAKLGVGGALVLLGEPGVGKSALLEDTLASLGEMRVLRATGLEAERHIPFAGLLQLVRPALGDLDRLSPPQAAALSGALALSEAGAASGDRLAIGAAVLSLVTGYAEQGPVALVLDDLHLLDLPSAEAVVFAARRLVADPVVLLAAARTGEAERLVSGLPVVHLSGLDHQAAEALVTLTTGGPLVPGRLEPLLALAGGNPLALVELAGDDLDALATEPSDLPARVPDTVTEAFARRLDRLDPACRTAVLVAAVCGGDLLLTTRACSALGVEVETLAGAEDDGLLSVRSGAITFRHPLVRAAVYSRAGARDRREAHRAVAASLPETDADRRAWHLAEAVWQPDAAVADELAEAAARAQVRTAYSVASGGFERSARLTPDRARRTERLLRAADAAFSAGLTERALGLLEAHGRESPDHRGQMQELALRGLIAARTGRVRDAREMLVAAADLAADPDEETVFLADAVQANFYLADATAAAALVQRLAELAPSLTDDRARALGLAATGIARVLTGQPGGADDLRAAVPLLQAAPELYRDPHRLSLVIAVPLYLRDSGGGRALRDLVAEMQGQGVLGALPSVLWHLARDQATTSEWAEAEANYATVVRMAEETGHVTEQVMALAGLAWLESREGLVERCRAHAAQVLAAPATAQLHMAEAWSRYALGDLELSLGEPARAARTLRGLVGLLERHEVADVDLVPAAELVDALLRLGELEEAHDVAATYEGAAREKGQPWALARAGRARGLLADDEAAGGLFEAALEAHAATLDRFETARTRLAYGERLRRAARRVQAREQLRAALDEFEDLGARRWAERAAQELAATGETVRRRDADPRTSLTPQELQVSMLLVQGSTTREAAAALFLSPKTVEYHLRKVYTKLGIGSRAELAQLLAPTVPVSAPRVPPGG